MDCYPRIELEYIDEIEIPNKGTLVEFEAFSKGASCLAYTARWQGAFEYDRLIIKEAYPEDLAIRERITRSDEKAIIPGIRSGERVRALEASLESEVSKALEEAKSGFFEFQDKQIKFYAQDSLHFLKADVVTAKNGNVYAISSLEQGKSLDRCFNTIENRQQVFELINSLLNALKNIHGSGDSAENLYLDIKPENIFVMNQFRGESRCAALFDFDAVASLSDINNGETIHFSRDWAPWELKRFARQEIGAWTDIYSVGLVLLWSILDDKDERSMTKTLGWIRQGGLRNETGKGELREKSRYYRDMGFSDYEHLTLANILEVCLQENPSDRRKGFAASIDKLQPSIIKCKDKAMPPDSLSEELQNVAERNNDPVVEFSFRGPASHMPKYLSSYLDKENQNGESGVPGQTIEKEFEDNPEDGNMLQACMVLTTLLAERLQYHSSSIELAELLRLFPQDILQTNSIEYDQGMSDIFDELIVRYTEWQQNTLAAWLEHRLIPYR
jgi:serine/threonine protein kinase